MPFRRIWRRKQSPPLRLGRGPWKVWKQDSEFTLALATCPAVTRWDLDQLLTWDQAAEHALQPLPSAPRSLWLHSIIRSAGDVGCFCLNKIVGGFHLQPAGAAQALDIKQAAWQWLHNQSFYIISDLFSNSAQTSAMFEISIYFFTMKTLFEKNLKCPNGTSL